MSRSVLVVGATSGLGRALAAQYARRGARVIVAGRSNDRVAATAADLRVRYGADVGEIAFDALDPSAPARTAAALAMYEDLDLLVFALGDNGSADAPLQAAEIARVHAVNFGAIAALLAHLLPSLRRRKGAAFVFVGSVAADRGRRGNFVYASAKAALATYAEGLGALLHADGVSVTLVKLGWVDTRLSYGMVPASLTMSAPSAARAIEAAVRRRRGVVYVPWPWRFVMLAVRAIPAAILRRLSLR